MLADVQLQAERLERQYKPLVRTVGADIPALVALGVPDVVAAGRQADDVAALGTDQFAACPASGGLPLPPRLCAWAHAGVNGALARFPPPQLV